MQHFGIVPIEAMAAGRPVVAANSGGPKESIAHGETGLLCDPTPAAFAAAYRQLLAQGAEKAKSMGVAARARVEAKFSRTSFGKQLDTYVRQLAAAAARLGGAAAGGSGAGSSEGADGEAKGGTRRRAPRG